MSRKINCPVVLIHGFGDIPALSGSWVAFEEVLRKEAGVPNSDILTLQISPFGLIEDWTKSAIHDITSKFEGKSVHLIAHSMGGLNARDIAARSGTDHLRFTVLTVTTLGTPHLGAKILEGNAFFNAIIDILGIPAPALTEMKLSMVTAFSARTRVNPKVKYFTWAGYCSAPTPLFAGAWMCRVGSDKEPTDCVVDVSSATWDPSYCTCLGVINGADHFTILQEKTAQDTIPHLQAAETGGSEPIVKIENTWASAFGNRIRGDIHTLTAPGKALKGLLK